MCKGTSHVAFMVPYGGQAHGQFGHQMGTHVLGEQVRAAETKATVTEVPCSVSLSFEVACEATATVANHASTATRVHLRSSRPGARGIC